MMDILKYIDNFVLQHTQIILISLACLFLACLYFHYKSVYSYWEKRGVKGPKPLPIVGNMLARFMNDPHKLTKEWYEKYGKVYGIYDGTRPCLVIADAEVFRQICIKDFDVVINRRALPFVDQYQKHTLFALRDQHWERVRALMTSTFTSGKIKKMFILLDTCANDMVQCFKEKLSTATGSVVNLKELYSLFTMDTISTCCYGLKLEREGSADLKTAASRNEMVRLLTEVFIFRPWRLLVLMILPTAIVNLIGFKMVKSNETFVRIIQRMMDGRRKSGKKIDDYLQLLMDANLDNQLELDELDEKENYHASLTRESLLEDQKKMVKSATNGKSGDNSENTMITKNSLTDIETISNAMALMIVGLETTSNMLSNCCYALAFHQDIQERLYEEIKKLPEWKDDKSQQMFDYADLTSCVYLDAVISETLRSMATIVAFERDVSRDYHIEKYNVTLEKGGIVQTAWYQILNDPDYWPEPRKFDPERFMPENKNKIVPGSYCPFGIGPRHCIGMRFSLIQSKLALAKIITNFRFEPAPGTSFPPDFVKSIGLTSMKRPLVKLIAR